MLLSSWFESVPQVVQRGVEAEALCHHATQSYWRLFESAATCLLACEPEPEGAPPRLTARELEVLRWTMEGKTAWEIGAILGISEQTAARHLNKATRKLGCVNKVHAVVKAMRLGLVR